jgi:2-haloacid dehalogenase
MLSPRASIAGGGELIMPGQRLDRRAPMRSTFFAMPQSPLTHSAYVFDAYGTLFDVHAAVRSFAGEIGPDGQLLSEIWRAKQLEYSWVRTLMGSYEDFWTLTQQALDFAFAKVPSADAGLRQKLLDAYWQLDCYGEVPRILRALKAEGARVAILSNGSPSMLESAVRSAALEPFIDEIFSVDSIGRFKTDPGVYDLVTTAWRLYPSKISFQSSNRWDIAGAAKFGFTTVWINRSGQPDEYADLRPELILPSLEGLVSS